MTMEETAGTVLGEEVEIAHLSVIDSDLVEVDRTTARFLPPDVVRAVEDLAGNSLIDMNRDAREATLRRFAASLLSSAWKAGREEGRWTEQRQIEQWLRDLADKVAEANQTDGSAARSIAADIRWAANRLADEYIGEPS